MSFIRCMSSGVMFCIAPDICSTIWLRQLLADLVEQLLEALRGLRRLEVVCLQLAHLAGEVVGQHVEAEVAVRRGVACGLRTPLVATALGGLRGVVDGMTLFVDDVVRARRRSRCRHHRGRNWSSRSWRCSRNLSISSRRPCRRSPLRSRMPSCIIRRSAELTSPWYSRSSVSSSNSASASRSKPRCVPSQRE